MKSIVAVISFIFTVNLSAQYGNVDTNSTVIDTVAQTKRYNAIQDSIANEKIYDAAEYAPEYVGGGPAFGFFIEKNMIYPPLAKQNNIQGKVYVTFVVDKKGVVKDPKVSRSLGYGCDEEAIRLVKKMPKWKPGITFDQKVNTRVTMAIPFTIKK